MRALLLEYLDRACHKRCCLSGSWYEGKCRARDLEEINSKISELQYLKVTCSLGDKACCNMLS